MGFSLSWVAVKGRPTADILGELELRQTGARGLEGESPFVGSLSDDGWYLIVMSGADHRLLAPAVLERLSAGCDLLTCTVEEHVMFSQATGWKDGRRLWQVTHDAEDGPFAIDEEGTLPPEYAPIRERLTNEQEAAGGADSDVDYLFDVPVVLVQTFIGYKHDELTSAFQTRGFEVLEPVKTRAQKSSLLGRIFGKS
jgi:hypothetical protein